MAALASKHPAFSLAVDGRVPGPLPKASFNQQQGSGEGAGILAGFAKKKKKPTQKTLIAAHLRVPELM